MTGSRKTRSLDAQGFSQSVIDRAVKTLGVKPSDRHVRSDGSITTVEDEIRQRLNSIKILFNTPECFDDWVAPAKMRKLIGEQHRKILDALDILRSLRGSVGITKHASKMPNLVKRWLFEVSEVNPALSPGLIGYDVMSFDRNFSTAIESLEKIEACFSSVLKRAELTVKGPGKTKPKNDYANHLLGLLCGVYRDFTNKPPKAWPDTSMGTARGNIIEFLDCVLPEFFYPHEKTHYALEKKIRSLKTHENYGQLWSDGKE